MDTQILHSWGMCMFVRYALHNLLANGMQWEVLKMLDFDGISDCISNSEILELNIARFEKSEFIR